MTNFIKQINNIYSVEEEREMELAQQRKNMQDMQEKLDLYTKQEVYDYHTAKTMLEEIQTLYRIYEAEEFFGTTQQKAVIH